jgi:hypothetical protein
LGGYVLSKRGLLDMAHDVFISYSADDKPIADAMCSALESNGIRCWIAPRDILPGMDWGGSIIDAIAASRVMVLVLSSNSNTSSQVKREVERAVSKEVIVIPFRIEDVSLSKSLEYHLSATHWMDALTPPIEDHLQTLAERIKQLLPTESKESIPVQPKRKIPIQPAPSPYKRLAVYLGAGLVIGLIVLVGLVLWSGQKNPTSESTAAVPTPTVATPTVPTPRSEQNTAQEKATPNQNQSSNNSAEPNTGGQLSVPKIYGKTYGVARKLLIKEGWQPHEQHISHGNDPDVQSGNGPIFWKRGYRELVTCSGTGLAECLFEFIDPTERVLQVVTQGEEDENGAYHASVKRVVFRPK